MTQSSTPRADVAKVREVVAGSMSRARSELAELVRFRSVADPAVEDPAHCQAAAAWVREAFEAEGLDSRVARTPDGSDAVIARHDAGPDAPSVLLYAHYDVQPVDADDWTSPPFELTERDGRWYGRGAADCKGAVIAHLLALRALREIDGDPGVSVTVVVEGSEEQGTGGLERYVEAHPEEVAADVIIIGDVGNVAVGVPTLTTVLRGMVMVTVRVRALAGNLHSGAFGGAAPDALAALIAILGSLRDESGDTVVTGLESDGTWQGDPYDAADFARDAGLVPGTEVIGSGTVGDQLWARPSATVVGIDAPAVTGALPALQAHAAARVSLRIPPGVTAEDAEAALDAHLRAAAPWGVQVEIERNGSGEPFSARTDTRGFELLSAAMSDAFEAPARTTGQGGSIPLTATLSRVHPDASIVMIGLAEPASRMHASDESVDPGELERMAIAEALFLRRFADDR